MTTETFETFSIHIDGGAVAIKCLSALKMRTLVGVPINPEIFTTDTASYYADKVNSCTLQ